MPVAITRQVSPRFAECELTHIERQPIDLDLARAQHHGYTQALQSLGCELIELRAEIEYPDSVFVEDAAFILPELAVIMRPGALSRRGEIDSIAEALRPYHELVFIQEPATIDGGDILTIGRDIYVGLSTRSSASAIEQLLSHLSLFGYHVHGVSLHGCLHLKSAVTRIDDGSLLINREYVEWHHFERFELVDVSPDEPSAANLLMIGERGLYPAAFPRTCEILLRRGIPLITIDLSELAKAEGAITCCSLIIL
jgi:dimethylargininase